MALLPTARATPIRVILCGRGLDAKKKNHAAACDAVGLRFVAAAFTTLGGWGRTVRKQLHTLYAKKKKEEKKAGGSGWDTIRWKQDLLERTCIAMAIANFRLLDAHTRAS